MNIIDFHKFDDGSSSNGSSYFVFEGMGLSVHLVR